MCVPKVSDENLQEQDDRNWYHGKDQCGHQIAQYQPLLRVADVRLPMPLIRPVSPHGKSALALAEDGNSIFEEVGDDQNTDHH